MRQQALDLSDPAQSPVMNQRPNPHVRTLNNQKKKSVFTFGCVLTHTKLTVTTLPHWS